MAVFLCLLNLLKGTIVTEVSLLNGFLRKRIVEFYSLKVLEFPKDVCPKGIVVRLSGINY